jgi:hypothetical protein
MSLLRASLFTLASLSLINCVQPDSEVNSTDIAAALPTAAQVQIKLPKSSNSALIGETAEWYQATRSVTQMLNGGTAWVLTVVHTVVQFPVTSRSGDTLTWGPYSSALDPAEWKLDVTQLADGSYHWKMSARSKTQANAGFESVIDGNAVAGDAIGQGHGTFSIDFDAAERVNPADNNGEGQFVATYDLPARHLTIDATRLESHNGVLAPITTHYVYSEAANGSGDMLLALHGDTEDAGVLPEDATIHSRWLATGAGRADIRLANGDLAATVTGSECWDTAFGRVYYSDSATFMPTEGNAAACVFATASMP